MYILLKFIMPGGKSYTKIADVLLTQTFKSIYSEHSAQFASYDCDKYFCGSKNQQHTETDMVAAEGDMQLDKIGAVMDINKILFVLNQRDKDVLPQVVNVNTYLMASNQRLQYPKMKKITDGRSELYNSLIDYLKSKGAQFFEAQNVDMTLFMDSMTKILWTIDGQSQKFRNAPGVPPIPSCFSGKNFRRLEHDGVKKKPIPSMNIDELIQHATCLESLLSKRFMNSAPFKEVRTDVTTLSEAIHAYVDHLNRATRVPSSNANENIDTYVVNGSNTSNITIESSMYNVLYRELTRKEPYDPVNLKLFAPVPYRDRYFYIRKLQLPFDVQVYKKTRPSVTFAWKLPDEIALRTDKAFATTIKKIECDLIPELTSKNRQRLVKENQQRSKWQRKEVKDMIQFMNGKIISTFKRLKFSLQFFLYCSFLQLMMTTKL